MRAAGKAGKQNTENTRPVYTRELPFGRTLAGAGTAPGAYGRDGSFVPWEKLHPGVIDSGEGFILVSAGAGSGSQALGAGSGSQALVLPDDIAAVGASVFRNSSWGAVILPDGCRTVGDGAFFGAGAVYIRFPVSFSSAGRLAFSHSSLRSAVVPFSAETGPGAFHVCLRLVSACVPVPSGKDPFLFCGELVTVHTPRGCFAAGRM